MKTRLDNLIDEIQFGDSAVESCAAEMRNPFRDEFEKPKNGWMVERERKIDEVLKVETEWAPADTPGTTYGSGHYRITERLDSISVVNLKTRQRHEWRRSYSSDDRKYDMFSCHHKNDEIDYRTLAYRFAFAEYEEIASSMNKKHDKYHTRRVNP